MSGIDEWRVVVELEQRDATETIRSALQDVGITDIAGGEGHVLLAYFDSASEAEQAREVIASRLTDLGVGARVVRSDRWIETEGRWSSDPVDSPDRDDAPDTQDAAASTRDRRSWLDVILEAIGRS